MRKFVSLFLVLILVFPLSACSGGISKDEAEAHIDGFLEKVSSEDYKAAEKFLHPERPADLQTFFEALKDEEDVDFSSINIEKYTSFKSALFDSTINGSTYSMTMEISSADTSFQMEIEIVKNDNGYGIYNLDIDFD